MSAPEGAQRALETALALERAGRPVEAAHAYLAAGAVEAAARVLAAAGAYADASRLLLSLVGPDAARDGESRRLTYHAAICLAHAGDRHGAASLLRLIGDDVRAAAILGQAPPAVRVEPLPPATIQSGVAAQQARAAGRPRDAAAIFLRAGLSFEAGICLFEAGDYDEALVQLLTVLPSSARYRSAAVRVIHIIAGTGMLPFEVDNFLATFARSDPTTPHEITALHALGVLYQGTGFEDEARETFERVLRADPHHADARGRLAALQPKQANDYAALAEQDLSFWAPVRRTVPDIESDIGPAPVVAAASGPRIGLASLKRGSLIAGRYEIDREIGRGGMGVVYSARDTDLAERVALKAFTERVDDPGLIARFKQELTLSRQLTHENVIRLHDMGVHEGCRFITMELLTGESLKDKLQGLELSRALGYIAQVCAGLGAIHARGIVHRDIKAANVFVTQNDVVKVMDFGLAKKEGVAEGITVSGFMAGTPGYMPPEQITSFGSVTAAADLYALGVLAYELMVGTRPFRHRDPSQIFRLQFTTEPTPPRQHNPAIPQAVEDIVLRLLNRDPALRPTTQELALVVEQARRP